MSRPASLPQPPYYAVIFVSQRRATDQSEYDAASARMLELAQRQPGYLGVDSARGADGFGLTVSYWRDEGSIAAWKHDAEHAATRERGRSAWYEAFEVRVARVERAYGSGAAP